MTAELLRNHYGFIAGSVSFSTMFLAYFVYIQSKTRPLTKIYAFWALSVGLWSFFLVLNIFAPNAEQALIWCRMLHVWAIIIPAAYVHFVLLFLNKYETKKVLVFFLYVVAGLFIMADFTPWFLISTYREKFHFYVSTPQLLYPYHLAVFLSSISYVYYELIRSLLKKKDGVSSQQVKYFFIATLSAYSGGVTNYFINYDYLIFPLYPYANIGVLVYVALVGLLITRYRFMDIEVIVKKTLVFAGLFGMVMVIVTIVTSLVHGVMGKYLSVDPTWSVVLSGLLIIVLYDPTRKLIVNITDRFLFQKKFKLTTIVAQASQAISLIQSLKWLSKRIVAFLVTTCRIKSAAIYVCNNTDRSFLRTAIRGYPKDSYPIDRLTEDHAIIRYLMKTKVPVEINKLREKTLSDSKSIRSFATDELNNVVNFLSSFKAEVMIPSFLGRRIEADGAGGGVARREDSAELRNILLLGAKKSDEPYTDEELEVFYGLAQESAIAVENARLYDEAVERTRLLVKTNKELADTNEKLKVTQASLIVAEKNATMVGMAKAIGHEVNNPLAVVMYRVDSIYRSKIKKWMDQIEQVKDVIPEEKLQAMKKLVTSIEDDSQRAGVSARRINVVVHTLTNILKDTKGEIGPLNLTVLCREALEALRFSTYDENLQGCEIEMRIVPNLNVLGNIHQLLQVLVNLLKNAYEAMDKQENRHIEIRADFDPDDPQMARIEVADNGPGIPDEVLPKIWVQGFSTKHKKDDSIGAAGQGQGLFVCKHIIESVHKGTINVESAVGKGTVFTIRLPLAEVMKK